jgi:hypothetical protein
MTRRAAQRPWNRAARRSTKERTPSAASSLRDRRCWVSMNSCIATTGPCSSAFNAFSRVATTASGACAAIEWAMASASSSSVPAGTTFLHKVQPQRLGAAELVSRQQVQQSVAQAGALGHAQGRAARGHDAALDLKLREPAVVGRDDDVGRQHQFDAEGIGDALDGHDHRLGAAAVAIHAQIHRIHQSQRDRLLAALHQRCDGGQVEPGREMVAQGVQNAHPQCRIVVEPGIASPSSRYILGVKPLRLARAVDTDQQHGVSDFAVDAAFGMGGSRGGGGHAPHGSRARSRRPFAEADRPAGAAPAGREDQ